MIDYLAAARACRTENQYNRLHIDFDTTLSPVEIAAIQQATDHPDFPEAGRAWLRTVDEQSPTLFGEPERFTRLELHENVQLYRGTGTGRRRLLIAFTGVARRLMIPTAAFLQALDSRDWDVVLLKYTCSFLDGVADVADDLDGLVTYVGRKVGYWRYRSVTTFGVSSGGGPAAAAALRIGARRGVSMCGASGERLLAASTRPRLWPRLLGRRPELVFVHGVNNAPDRTAAAAMAATWGGTIVPVDGVRSHNVMGSLLKRGLLRSFLAETL